MGREVKRRGRRWLAGLAAAAAAGVVAVLAFPAEVLTAPRHVEPREPPAFYSGTLYDAMATRDYTPEELFGPSQARSWSGKLYSIGTFPPAERCGECHRGIYKNWKATLHAKAAVDPWYLRTRELFAVENPKGELALRSCAGCHAPVALMQGEVGLYNKETASSLEGVGCAFCHTVEQVKGPNGGYVSHPERIRRYRGGGDPLLAPGPGLAASLLMAYPAVHRQDLRPDWMHGESASRLCEACHDQVINGVYVQSVYQEWRASRYAKQGVSCQDCHFTPGPGPNLADGQLVEGYGKKRAFYPHRLTGASVVNAPGHKVNAANLRAALALEARVMGRRLEVVVENKGAGHSLPTGAGDLRQLWLEVVAWDGKGHEVFSSGKLDRAGYLDPDAVVFRQVLVDDRGEPLRRHDVWRVAAVASDTRLKADERRRIVFDLPASARKARVRLLWRDAHADFLRIVLKQDPRRVPVIELKRWSGRIGALEGTASEREEVQ